ncbi:visual pigment-like receptor peropsin [Galendromus occidentalis]|uniref:Visual pigment-like receptor peropsin n=1 Tax=Galendromus occidentalis TaxID=34638 RepID=A0AAJ7P9V9_9ACAR|nr:visual pigment-like receptor peropsin [Galendromus occidentalis]
MHLSKEAHMAIGIFLIVSGIIGIIANSAVIASFIMMKSRLSPVSIVLLNLTLSDLGIILMGFPFNALSHLSGGWLFGWIGCQIYGYCCFLFGTAHIGGLSLLAYEQYRSITRMRPDAAPSQSYLDRLQRNYIFYGLAIWVFALIWATPPLLGWSRYYYEPFGTACTIDWRDETFEFKFYIVAYFIGGYVLPFSLMLHSFRRIIAIKKAYKQNSVRLNQRGIIETLKRQREEDLTLTCILTVVSFLLTWTPYAILCLWSVFLGPHGVPSILALGPNICAKASGALNPIIYTLSNRRMRARIANSLRKLSGRKRRNYGSNSTSDEVPIPLRDQITCPRNVVTGPDTAVTA